MFGVNAQLTCVFMLKQDNTLDFQEYLAALHLILRGNLEDRLKWSFKMYDKDANGRLDRMEVKQFVKVRGSSLELFTSKSSYWRNLFFSLYILNTCRKGGSPGTKCNQSHLFKLPGFIIQILSRQLKVLLRCNGLDQRIM